MPQFDGTGPDGKGPRTGRGKGNCGKQNDAPRRGFGRGLGCGFGRGFGRRRTNESQNE